MRIIKAIFRLVIISVRVGILLLLHRSSKKYRAHCDGLQGRERSASRYVPSINHTHLKKVLKEKKCPTTKETI